MDISVIVTTYNQEDTIARTLDSVLSQQIDAEFEIIIGDDCSTDGTEAVCRRYEALYPDRITYLRRPSNMGVVANYFDCIVRARGQFLADCAGDDFWTDPHKLAMEFDVFRADPSVSLVATQWECYDEAADTRYDPAEQCPPGYYPKGSLLVPVITNSVTVHLCSSLYRRDIILKLLNECPDVCTDPEFSCEDVQILLAMTDGGTIVVLPQKTLAYSVGHESVSHRHSFADRFDYSRRTLRQSLILQSKFLPSPSCAERRSIELFNRRTTEYLAAQAFRSGSKDIRNRFRTFIADHNMPLSAKTRAYLMAMASLPVWELTRRLRESFDKN